MIKRTFTLLLFLISIFYSEIILADINSATITADTLKALPNCVHYKLRGICYWLSKTGINTTPYIEQYLPDVVVSVFNKPGDNPWMEINHSLDQAGRIAESNIVSSLTNLLVGDGQESLSDAHEQNTFFKEVDVMGNPALALLPDETFLTSSATPLMPYYQSMLDAAAWRGLPQVKTTLAEETYAMAANLQHHIGTFPINWGGLYPHEGKIATSNDAKAAAVIAQRASDLITSNNSLVNAHIHQALSNQCGQECHAAPIQVNSSHTQFQMIYPVAEDQCDYFGKTASFGDDMETKTQGAYVWVVWRFYRGCIQGDGKFLSKTIIN